MTKLSFIVTSYNYANFIEKNLNSIKNQTFNDFEIIVVDDFSDDNSIEIIKNFINRNPNLKIKLIKHDKNQGQLKACITGLNKAEGEYITFVDSDDILLSTYAEELLKAHEKENVGFISCNCIKINENDEEILEHKPKNNGNIKKLNLFSSPFGGWYWMPMTSAMFKKSTLETIKNYENTDEWRICPDKFLFNLVHLTNSSARFDKILVKKRCHKNNAGNFNRRKINFENNKKIRKCTLNFIKKFYKKNLIKYVLIIYLSYFYVPIQILKYVKNLLTSKFHQN